MLSSNIKWCEECAPLGAVNYEVKQENMPIIQIGRISPEVIDRWIRISIYVYDYDWSNASVYIMGLRKIT